MAQDSQSFYNPLLPKALIGLAPTLSAVLILNYAPVGSLTCAIAKLPP